MSVKNRLKSTDYSRITGRSFEAFSTTIFEEESYELLDEERQNRVANEPIMEFTDRDDYELPKKMEKPEENQVHKISAHQTPLIKIEESRNQANIKRRQFSIGHGNIAISAQDPPLQALMAPDRQELSLPEEDLAQSFGSFGNLAQLEEAERCRRNLSTEGYQRLRRGNTLPSEIEAAQQMAPLVVRQNRYAKRYRPVSNAFANLGTNLLRANCPSKFGSLLRSKPTKRVESSISTDSGQSMEKYTPKERKISRVLRQSALDSASIISQATASIDSWNPPRAQNSSEENEYLKSSGAIRRVYFKQPSNCTASQSSQNSKSSRNLYELSDLALGGSISDKSKRYSPYKSLHLLPDSVGEQNQDQKVIPLPRRKSAYGATISSPQVAQMSCNYRRKLFYRRRLVSDAAALFAVFGWFLAVIANELSVVENTKNDVEPLKLMVNIRNNGTIGVEPENNGILILVMTLQSICIISTMVLLSFVISYYVLEFKILLVDCGADDWRVIFTLNRFFRFLIEFLICAVCPIPGLRTFRWPEIDREDYTKLEWAQVDTNMILTVLMFGRIYLIGRFVVLHSRQFQDASTRSIAALNHITMDFHFVIKTKISQNPIKMLIMVTVSYCICVSWAFTQCECYAKPFSLREHYYLNSLWFVFVTFLSIGYGEIVPSTYCGRVLSIATGIMGAGVSSVLIAVIHQKLELSRAEKHVNNFMADSKLTKQVKNAAAAVLQNTWFIHKFKKWHHKTGESSNDMKLRVHQRKFLKAIDFFRTVKWEQRNLMEKSHSLIDFGTMQTEMRDTVREMHRNQDHLMGQIELMMTKMSKMQNSISEQQIIMLKLRN